MELDKEKQIVLFVGAAFGAALMFTFDPSRGARRRALVRNKASKGLRPSGRAIHDRSEDIGNRLTGTFAEIRAKGAPPPTDHQLEERGREEPGRKVEHPKSIDVIVDDGFVTLRANMLRSDSGDIPALQS